MTFAWRPSNCLADGEVVSLVQLAGNFTEWKPVNMTPPPCPKPRLLSSSSTSSDYVALGDLQPNSNLNHLGYWTLQRFLSPGNYEYKYVVTSKNEQEDGKETVAWVHDSTKESKPDGMGGTGRNNVLQVEAYHKGIGGSMSLSRTISRDDTTSEVSVISDDDSDVDEDISIIQKEEGTGDGWVILSRKSTLPSQEEAIIRVREPSNGSDHTESQRSSESSIEIIDAPESLLESKESQLLDTEVGKHESHSRVSTTTPVRSPGCDIERTFLAPSDYQKRLTDLGFVPVKHFRDEILDDSYYDFCPSNIPGNGIAEINTNSIKNEYLLLSNDHWLLQRNGDWGLKYPVNSKHSLPPNLDSNIIHSPIAQNDSQINKMTLYHETSCADDIISKLKAIAPSAIKDDATLNQLLLSGILRPFAKLRTSRNCFKLSHIETSRGLEEKTNANYDVNIIVERTSWGCLIGEIEVIVESQNEVAMAAAEIERLARILDFKPLDLSRMINCVGNE